METKLTQFNDSIYEVLVSSNGNISTSMYTPENNLPYNYQTIYYNYPYTMYTYTDKYKTALDVVKMLQQEGLIELKSIPKFISLIEKIANKL